MPSSGMGAAFPHGSKALLADPSSAVTASSTLGINGQVNIQAPVTSMRSVQLPPCHKPLPRPRGWPHRVRCGERFGGEGESVCHRWPGWGAAGTGGLLWSPLERMDQTGVVARGEQERQSPEAQQEWVVQAQAQAQGEWEVECARWVGKPETTARPKRSR